MVRNNNKLNLNNLPIIIGITGASGTIYGLRALQFLIATNYKVELVTSKGAIKVAECELGLNLSDDPNILKEQVLSYSGGKKSLQAQNLNVWSYSDLAAPISSGSYRTQGMIIIPASMGTISAISCGLSDNLISRAADVCLKERRKLLLVPREMPLNTIHLENLTKLSKIGVIIAPASPGFYHNPKEITDIVDFVVGKVLDQFGIDHNLFKRWREGTRFPVYNFEEP